MCVCVCVSVVIYVCQVSFERAISSALSTVNYGEKCTEQINHNCEHPQKWAIKIRKSAEIIDGKLEENWFGMFCDGASIYKEMCC